jgi:predicted transcriptional regulator
MTEFQQRCVNIVNAGLNGQATITDIAHRLKTSRLAVYSSMMSLQKQEIVGSFRSSPDQWGVITYFVRRK